MSKQVGLSQRSALLLGNYRPALVVARSLKEKGYHVISGLEGCDRGAEHSRCVDEIWDHAPIDSTRFGSELHRFVEERTDIELVIPISEQSVRMFAEANANLPGRIALVMNEPRLVEMCLDKTVMLDLAEKNGVPVAQHETVKDLAQFEACTNRLGYPLVIRPMESTKRLFGKKAITLENRVDYRRLFGVWPDDHEELLVQSKVTGKRHNVYFAAIDGDIQRYLHARIDRTDRPDGSGLAVEGVTLEADPILQGYTTALLSSMKYSGIGCAQYLVDEKSGKVFFLEINSRFAGNHAVPEYCGLNLTDFMLELGKGKPSKKEETVFGKTGIRYSWLAGDLEGFKLAVREGEVEWFRIFPWLRMAFSVFLNAHLDMMLDRNDPRPGLVNLLKVIPGMRHLVAAKPTPSNSNHDDNKSGLPQPLSFSRHS